MLKLTDPIHNQSFEHWTSTCLQTTGCLTVIVVEMQLPSRDWVIARDSTMLVPLAPVCEFTHLACATCVNLGASRLHV